MIGIKIIDLNIVEDQEKIIVKNNQQGRIVIFWSEIKINKLVIEVEENVNLQLIEIGEKNACFEIRIGKNSSLTSNVLTKDLASNISYEYSLDEGSFLQVGYADFSQGQKCLKATINLDGINSEVDWHLASLSKSDDKKEYQINFLHNVGYTKAKMENYGVCKDYSSLSFLGDAIIKNGSKKSSTKQNAKIMVFDKTCKAKASPKLCIAENDVEASHGASEGQINPEHIYYLMTRGLKEEEAKRLITLGYLSPIIKYFVDENLGKEIENYIINEV